MADREYVIKYVVDDSAAVRSLDNILGKLGQVDKAVDSLGTKLRDVAKQLRPADMTVAASQMASALGQLLGQATNARAALASVGADTSKMNSALNKADALASSLANVASNGAAAGAAVAGVGGGMRGGAGGGGGTGAGTIFSAGLARQTAFAAGRAGLQAIRQGADARKDYVEQATKKFNDFRAELQEVANLTGQPTVNDKVINEQLAFQKQTGMSADEAINFREQYLGAIGSAKLRGNITDDVAEKMGVSAAQFGLRYNLDPATTGKLAGLLGEYGKVPTAEAGAGKLAEVGYHLNVLGVGQVKSMIPSMIGLQGEMLDENGGRFASAEALSARLAASTVRAKSPSTAATQIRQANTALRRFGSEDVEGSTGYALKALGISASDDYETALKKLAPKITGPDGDQWLMKNGFANQAERRSLIAQAKLIPVVEKELGIGDPKQAAAIAKVRGEAAARNAGFMETDIGKQRTAEAGAFAQEIRAGQGQSRFERARLEAETRLRQRREIDSPTSSAGEALQTAANFGLRSGRDDRIEAEIYNEFMQRTGVTEAQISAKFPEFGQMYQSGFAAVRAQFGPEERAQLFGQVEAAFGGNQPGGNGGPGAKLNQAGQLLQQAAQQLQQPKPAPKAGPPPPGFVGGRP